MRKFVAFDLEIAREIPDGTGDWSGLRPLGISCAATLKVTREEDNFISESGIFPTVMETWAEERLRVWCGEAMDNGRYASMMNPSQCRELAHYLMMQQEMGWIVVTWNGAGFDFDVLAEECRDETAARTVKALTRVHVDVAFHMFAQMGFMCGLDAAARGSGLPGKTEGMSGEAAPAMWAGSRADQEKVLEYVAQDARVTAALYERLLEKRSLAWVTKRGRTSLWTPTRMNATPEGEIRPLTVAEAMELPEPDMSWMDKAWKRERFVSWLKE